MSTRKARRVDAKNKRVPPPKPGSPPARKVTPPVQAAHSADPLFEALRHELGL